MEVAIIGGGMAGLAAAYHLAQRDISCIVLEQQTVGWHGGGTAGRSRMYRHMYSERYFSDLAEQSVSAWLALSKKHNVELLDECGLLFYGNRGDEYSVEGTIPSVREVMTASGRPFEELDAATLRGRWPVAVDDDAEALFEMQAGTIWADQAMRVFREGGAEIVEHCTVTRIDEYATGVRLHTASGEIVEASRAIVAAGAWTPALLRNLGVDTDIEVWPMIWGHYRVTGDDDYPQWYQFGRPDGTDGGLYYGFPAEHGLVKVGIDWPMRPCVDMTDFPDQADPELAAHLDSFLREHWRGITDRVELRVSPYSMTSDNHFVLDQVPDHPRLTTFTGDCGRAFKFAPLIGQALASVTLGEQPPFDIGPLTISRPAIYRR